MFALATVIGLVDSGSQRSAWNRIAAARKEIFEDRREIDELTVALQVREDRLKLRERAVRIREEAVVSSRAAPAAGGRPARGTLGRLMLCRSPHTLQALGESPEALVDVLGRDRAVAEDEPLRPVGPDPEVRQRLQRDVARVRPARRRPCRHRRPAGVRRGAARPPTGSPGGAPRAGR